MYTGPHIVNDDLVFGYDTGYGVADNNTSTRFYPGRPTTNMASPDLKDWGTESGAQRIATGNYYKGQPTYNCRTAVGSHWLAIYNIVSNLRTAAGSGGTVTMSIWVRNNNSSTILISAYMGHDFSSNISISPNSDWQRIQWTVNQSSMGSDYCEFRPNTGTTYTYLEFTMPQIEVNVGTATPWTSTSRSNTQSLIDLKKSASLNLSNASFGSTGQPDFDGTSDSVLVGNIGGYIDKITVESIFKTSSSTNWKNMLCGANGDIIFTVYQAKLNFGCQGNSPIPHSNYSTTNVNDGQFHHGVATYDGSSVKIYVDGVLESTNTRSGAITPSTLRAGSNSAGNSEFFNGSIPLVKLYNKALTATEIKQNFNAYKNRFNI